MVPPAALAELHMDPRDPLPSDSHHALLGELDAGAIGELVAAAGPGSGSTLASVELRHTGGALARSAPHHGAVATLPGSFASFAVGLADEATAARTAADLERVEAAIGPYEAGQYLNFTEQTTAAESFFDADTAARLQAVKQSYDPERLFQANHEIGAGR